MMNLMILIGNSSSTLPSKTDGKCCDETSGSGCCDLITDFLYNPTTFILTLTTAYGSVFDVDLSSLAPDGVVDSVTFDPVTGILTVTTTAPATYQVNLTNQVVANTVFVTADGSDTTGTRERLDYPFATPWAAIAAAQPGDVVVVYPGTYTFASQVTTQRLVKDGVTMFCHPNTVIEFTSTALTSGSLSSPFSDDGARVIGGIYGQAEIVFLGSAPTNLTPCLSNIDSELTIECKSFYNRTRLTCTGGKKFIMRGEKHTGGDTSVVRMFMSTIQPMQFVHQFNQVVQDNAYNASTAGNGAFSPYQLRNFSPTGSIDITFDKLLYKTTFFSQGLFFCQFLQCPVKIHGTIEFTEVGNIGYENDYNLIGSAEICSANWDVDIRATNHSGLGWKWGTGGGAAPNYGRFRFSGVHNTPIEPTINSGARATISGLTANSRIELNLDLFVTNRTTTLLQWLDGTANTSVYHYITGKLRFVTTDLTATPFSINNSATNGAPYLKDLAVETDSTYIAVGGGAPQISVPCMSVYSNKGFDPVLHAAVIEPLTVSPSVKV